MLRSTQEIESQLKRELNSAFSVTQSLITGTGKYNIFTRLGTTTFNTNTQVTITVTAKNSSGANINTGGEVIYVEITNSCTKGVNFACVLDTGANTALTNSISAQMTDNSNGTYTYNYQVPMPGTITVSVLLYTQGGVYGEYFPNINESGNNVYNSINSTLNLGYALQDVFPGGSTYISANFYFRFKSPTTGILTFSIGFDDIITMYIGNYFSFIFRWCINTEWNVKSLSKYFERINKYYSESFLWYNN